MIVRKEARKERKKRAWKEARKERKEKVEHQPRLKTINSETINVIHTTLGRIAVEAFLSLSQDM